MGEKLDPANEMIDEGGPVFERRFGKTKDTMADTLETATDAVEDVTEAGIRVSKRVIKHLRGPESETPEAPPEN